MKVYMLETSSRLQQSVPESKQMAVRGHFLSRWEKARVREGKPRL